MRRTKFSNRKNTASLTKRGILGFSILPFVGHNKPFVRLTNPYTIPFICHYKPSICTSGLLRKQAGVSLIELMITLAIFAIIGAFAMPSFRQTLINHQTTARANEFLTDLNFARSEALKRGVPVEVCVPDATQTSCDFAGAPWSAGRIIGVRDPVLPPGTLNVIRVREPFSAIRSLNETTSGYMSVTFFNSGLVQFKFANGAIDPAVGATAIFGLCHDKDNDAVMDPEVGRNIRIGPTGGIRVTAPATACF